MILFLIFFPVDVKYSDGNGKGDDLINLWKYWKIEINKQLEKEL